MLATLLSGHTYLVVENMTVRGYLEMFDGNLEPVLNKGGQIHSWLRQIASRNKLSWSTDFYRNEVTFKLRGE